MNYTLGISVEKRQVQRLIDHCVIPTYQCGCIGNERIWLSIDIVRPGASPYRADRSGTALWAYHTKVREQTEAAHDASSDDQDRQSDKQPCVDGSQARGPLPAGHSWRGGKRQVSRQAGGTTERRYCFAPWRGPLPCPPPSSSA